MSLVRLGLEDTVPQADLYSIIPEDGDVDVRFAASVCKKYGIDMERLEAVMINADPELTTLLLPPGLYVVLVMVDETDQQAICFDGHSGSLLHANQRQSGIDFGEIGACDPETKEGQEKYEEAATKAQTIFQDLFPNASSVKVYNVYEMKIA